MNSYAFILGREYRLSLAELIHRFGAKNLQFHNEIFAIFSLEKPLSSEDFFTIGGSTRVIKIVWTVVPEAFATEVLSILQKENSREKIVFALAAFGQKIPLVEMGMRLKKTLSKNASVRFLNAKNENIHAAVFKKERLAKTHNEYVLLASPENFFFGRTIACQDIDAYARRDFGKERDMNVGMMPPKLVQMMINFLSERTQKNGIYDPFCGLGTTLIEAANCGIYTVAGSDISVEMVKNSQKSFADFIREERVWQERILAAGGVPKKDFSQVHSEFFALDATKIDRAFSNFGISKNINIVSEGYLWRPFRKEEINQDAVFSERRQVTRMYEKFFQSLREADFRGEIVMSFPFWKVHNVFIYLDEIPEIIKKNGFSIENLLPREMNLNTKNGSLLYRRDAQNVGREIMKIFKK